MLSFGPSPEGSSSSSKANAPDLGAISQVRLLLYVLELLVERLMHIE